MRQENDEDVLKFTLEMINFKKDCFTVFTINLNEIFIALYALVKNIFKGIVSRNFLVCLLMSFDRCEVPTQKERVLLLLKFRFRVEFFDFRISA
jgi:hypothetical protein